MIVGRLTTKSLKGLHKYFLCAIDVYVNIKLFLEYSYVHFLFLEDALPAAAVGARDICMGVLRYGAFIECQSPWNPPPHPNKGSQFARMQLLICIKPFMRSGHVKQSPDNDGTETTVTSYARNLCSDVFGDLPFPLWQTEA